MLKMRVNDEQSGRKLVRVLRQEFPQIQPQLLFRALRRRDIKLDGRRVRSDCTVFGGQEVILYGLSEALRPPRPYRIVHRDRRFLVISKPSGVSVHPDPAQSASEKSVIEALREQENDATLHLAHRLDRNTSGLLLIARGDRLRDEFFRLFREGLIEKRYHALVLGRFDAGCRVIASDGIPFFECRAYLEKRSRQNQVFIHDAQQPGDRLIVTRCRSLETLAKAGPDGSDITLLQIELPTGRTHQIRAHLAHLGNPVLGDGKYGDHAINRKLIGPDGPVRRQQLHASSLTFAKTLQKGPLADMAGRTFAEPHGFDSLLEMLSKPGPR